MTASRARQIVLAARPKGKPEVTDFHLEETTIPSPASGSFCSGSSTSRSTLMCAAAWTTVSPTRFVHYELEHVGALGAESDLDSDLVRPARLTSAAGGAIVAPGGGAGDSLALQQTRDTTR